MASSGLNPFDRIPDPIPYPGLDDSLEYRAFSVIYVIRNVLLIDTCTYFEAMKHIPPAYFLYLEETYNKRMRELNPQFIYPYSKPK
jgi:hypothetical protein